MTKVIRVAPHRILVFDNRSAAKIRDACMAGVVHKDVRLAGYQYGGETRFRNTTYSLDAPMNHTAGVKVAEALSDVE